MQYSKESLERQNKIKLMKEAWIICYANKFSWKQDIEYIVTSSLEQKKKKAEELMENWAKGEYKLAGRIISSRGMWKLLFWKIRDQSWEIQICFAKDKIVFNTWNSKYENRLENSNNYDEIKKEEKKWNLVSEIEIWWETKSAFKIAEKFCQIWDYIGIIWDLFLTNHGELTVFVKEFQILSKAIRPLPEKFHWLQDREIIYRQRYLDLITNKDSFDIFMFRSKFIKTIREFYWENSFVEIETPILGNAASWAAAQPFVTHHNDFDEDFFLRIAPEIALKKATVWRFERVFEIWKNFRNEWSDPSHVQEFSVVEHYAAWWNFEDNMKFTEKMFDYLFDKMNIKRELKIKDKNWEEKLVNFKTPFDRIDYIEGVKDKSGIDISKYGIEDEKKLRSDIKKAWFTWEWIDKQGLSTMIDYLYKKVLRPNIVGPAFVYNYPVTMQPLARQSDDNENIVEQFQLVLNWWEVLKAYSELVDPKIQKEKFSEQSEAIERWDEEATSWDDDFVLAMEYGMPCQSGWGMGIDRIVSLLTGQENLRDVILFPIMKSNKEES